MKSRLIAGLIIVTITVSTAGAQQVGGRSQASAQRVPVSKSGSSQAEAGPLQRLVTLDVHDVSLHQALDDVSRQSGLMLAYGEHIIQDDKRVTIKLHDVTAEQAFAVLLRELDVKVVVPAPGMATLVRAVVQKQRQATGMLKGTVTDAQTKRPIAGVTVIVGETGHRATSREDGTFQISGVPPGTYSVVVRMLGYAAQTQQVTIRANEDVVVDIALMQSAASPLNRVVVTGTLVATEQKELSSPITVVGSRDIQEQGITRLDQLFRGSIPGVIANDVGARGELFGMTMNVRGSTQLGATAQGATRFKTYIDGVEVADEQFVNNIDPSMIDHIEIIRGPEASTMYGSQAINGVMQIFTKKGHLGTTGPRVSGTLSMGFIESAFTKGATPQHDDHVSVTGGSKGGDVSYDAGASYNYIGPSVPASSARTSAAYAGGRAVLGPTTIQVSGRYSKRTFDQPNQQYFVDRIMDGQYKYSSASLAPLLTHYTLPQQTIASTITYTPSARWQHTLTIGQDQSSQDFVTSPPHLTGAAPAAPSGIPALDALQAALSSRDSLYTLLNIDSWRNSASYSVTNTATLSRAAELTTTVGGETWRSGANAVVVLDALHKSGSIGSVNNFVSDPSLTPLLGTSVSLAPTLQRYVTQNNGVFAQTRLGLSDALFLTAGLRAEDNTDFGKGYGLDYSPRFGVAYTWNVSDLSFKARAGYGKATRPPSPGTKLPSVVPTGTIIGNPNIGPETQRGTDYGIEAYLGNRASLVVTYYDQKAFNLITQEILSAPGAAAGATIYQYVNLGTVRNRGWEFQSTAQLAGLSLNATYSLFNSRILAIDPTDVTHQYRIGDQILGVPKSTGALSGSYRLGRTTLRAEVSRIGESRNIDYATEADQKNSRLASSNPPTAPRLVTTYPAYSRLSATLSQELTSRVEGFIRGDNLTNNTTTDFHNTDDILGRSMMFGVRIR